MTTKAGNININISNYIEKRHGHHHHHRNEKPEPSQIKEGIKGTFKAHGDAAKATGQLLGRVTKKIVMEDIPKTALKIITLVLSII